MEPLLTIDGVTKRYGDLVAVDEVSLDIYPGEIFALLGPNGAGKTTLINCISGLTVGFDGSIDVAGFDVVDDYRVTRRLIGLVPQEINYDAFFSVKNTLAFQGGYFGVPPDDEQIEELLREFSLLDKIDATSRWLSGGMKRRLMICKALMHDPVLLFLDEPTAGVDVELRDELWDYVRGLRDAGTTVVLTTHYLEEAEELADRIGIIHEGRLLRVQGRDAMMREFGSHTATIELIEPVPDDFAARFEHLELQVEGRRIDIAYHEDGESGPSPIDQVLREIYAEGLSVDQLVARSSSLEEIFKELVFDREAS